MKRMSVAPATLALPLAAGLLLAGSWAGVAEGIERGRRTSVAYSSGYYSSGSHVDGGVVTDEAAAVSDGNCETCGTPQVGCRRGCCANAWDGYCEERRGGCCRGCCANAWDGYCDEQRGCNRGCRPRRCKTSCCAPACDSCGCQAATDGTMSDGGETKPAAQPEPAAKPEPAPPQPPKPGLDRSASLRRVR